MWTVDLHIHSRFSPDSLAEPADLVKRARALGLDRIAITEHNNIDGALAARALAPEMVIVGEEVVTAEGGELIAYFVREAIPAGLPLREAVVRLQRQGAVISISHPLDQHRHSAMGERLTLEIIDEVDALEVFNARCLSGADNLRAAELAARYGKAVTAGSDAHTPGELGRGRLRLPAFDDDPGSFRASLGQACPEGRLSGLLPHIMSYYAKWSKRRAGR